MLKTIKIYVNNILYHLRSCSAHHLQCEQNYNDIQIMSQFCGIMLLCVVSYLYLKKKDFIFKCCYSILTIQMGVMIYE